MAKHKKTQTAEIRQATKAVGHAVTDIVEARYVRPSQMFLRFADGVEGTWTFAALKLNMSGMKLSTIKAAGSRAFIDVQSKRGDEIHLDSSALRYLVDPKYAEKIDKSIADLHMSPAEAEEASRLSKLTRDPRWHDVGDEDDLFE